MKEALGKKEEATEGLEEQGRKLCRRKTTANLTNQKPGQVSPCF